MLRQLLIGTIAIVVTTYVLPGVHIDNLLAAIVVALVLGLVNTIIRPLMVFITIPITLITLGLFLFIINALMVLLTDVLVPGFAVDGLGWALLFSIINSIIAAILSGVFKD